MVDVRVTVRYHRRLERGFLYKYRLNLSCDRDLIVTVQPEIMPKLLINTPGGNAAIA